MTNGGTMPSFFLHVPHGSEPEPTAIRALLGARRARKAADAPHSPPLQLSGTGVLRLPGVISVRRTPLSLAPWGIMRIHSGAKASPRGLALFFF